MFPSLSAAATRPSPFAGNALLGSLYGSILPGWQDPGDVNHGKKTPKFKWDCTICPSCCQTLVESIQTE